MRQLIEIVVRIVASSQVRTTASPHSEAAACCSPFPVATPDLHRLTHRRRFYSATSDADRHIGSSRKKSAPGFFKDAARAHHQFVTRPEGLPLSGVTLDLDQLSLPIDCALRSALARAVSALRSLRSLDENGALASFGAAVSNADVCRSIAASEDHYFAALLGAGEQWLDQGSHRVRLKAPLY